jgi:hypothetical protein
MGVSITEILSELDGDEGATGRDELRSILKCSAVLAPTTREGLHILPAGRSAENGPATEVPPVAPRELVQMTTAEFVRIAAIQKERYEPHSGAGSIGLFTQDQREPRRCINKGRDQTLKKNKTKVANLQAGYYVAWQQAGRRFEHVRYFAAGQVTLFQGVQQSSRIFLLSSTRRIPMGAASLTLAWRACFTRNSAVSCSKSELSSMITDDSSRRFDAR